MFQLYRCHKWQKIISLLSLFLASQFLITSLAQAGAVSVFEIRKSLPMDLGEPAVKDYYINGGAEVGLKHGQYLTVVRSTVIQDPSKNSAVGTIHIPVAKVFILQSEKGVSVARWISDIGPDDRPAVEFEGIMIGDELDLESVSLEPPKNKGKHHAAQDEVSTDRVAASLHFVEKPERPPAEAAPVKAAVVAPAANPTEKTTPPGKSAGMVSLAIPTSEAPGAGREAAKPKTADVQ